MSKIYFIATLINSCIFLMFLTMGLMNNAIFAGLCGVLTGIGYWRTDVPTD